MGRHPKRHATRYHVNTAPDIHQTARSLRRGIIAELCERLGLKTDSIMTRNQKAKIILRGSRRALSR